MIVPNLPPRTFGIVITINLNAKRAMADGVAVNLDIGGVSRILRRNHVCYAGKLAIMNGGIESLIYRIIESLEIGHRHNGPMIQSLNDPIRFTFRRRPGDRSRGG